MTNEYKNELELQIQYALMEQLSNTSNKQNKFCKLIGECVFELDAEGYIAFANEAWETKLGFAQGELAYSRLDDLLCGDNKAHIISGIEVWLATDKAIYKAEVQLKNKLGHVLTFILKLSKSDDPKSPILGMLFDISDRKSLENKLRVRETEFKRLSHVAMHTSNLVVITNKEGLITWVNSSFEALTGYTIEEVLHKKPGELLQGPRSSDETINQMSHAIKCRQSFNVEIVNYKKSGVAYWVQINASPVFDDHGNFDGFIAIQNDISASVRSKEALQLSELNYRTVVDNISEAIVKMDLQGQLQFANDAWFKLIGSNDSHLKKMNIYDYLNSRDAEKLTMTLQCYRDFDAVEVKKLDMQISVTSGEHWVEMSTVPVRNEVGELITIAATLVNIDERRLTEAYLEKSRQEAETLAHAKSRFMANISHEIRTPLNAIIGMSDLLTCTELSPEQARYVDMVQTSGGALLGILDDILTYTKNEYSALELESYPFRLDECLEEVIDITGQQALKKNISLVLDIDPSSALDVKSDKLRLRQVLLNLVSNAIKFSEDGMITLQAYSISKDEDCADVFIRVSDTGIGIPENKQKELFEPFFQHDVSITRRYGGSGLGLAICKQIVETAGGDITLESEAGVGTQITVRWPMPVSPAKEPTHIEKPVLVVSQNEFLAGSVEHTLKRLGFINCMWFRPDQLERCKPHGALLIDVSETTGRPAVISSRFADNVIEVNVKGTNKTFESLHSNHIVVNGPFKPSNLAFALSQSNLAEFIELDRKKYSTKAQMHYDFKDKKILIVEDNETNASLVVSMLRDTGAITTLAENGEVALMKVQKGDYDLVLMDIQMPVMDGITATNKIRGLASKAANTPIIALTADAIYGDRERFTQIGMNDYLSKPLRIESLLATVSKNLSLDISSTEDKKLLRIRNSIELLDEYLSLH